MTIRCSHLCCTVQFRVINLSLFVFSTLQDQKRLTEEEKDSEDRFRQLEENKRDYEQKQVNVRIVEEIKGRIAWALYRFVHKPQVLAVRQEW